MRVRWSIACALLFAGCRQLIGIDDPHLLDGGNGDAPDSALGGHDEDNDDVPDVVDNCPSVPNTDQERATGETVGVACDPRPGMSGDRIALFVPFFPQGTATGLQADASAMFGVDSLLLTGQQAQTTNDLTPTRIAIDVGFTSFLPPNALLSIEVGQHRCTIERCSGSGTFCLVARASASTAETDVPIGPGGVLQMDQLVGGVECRGGGVEAKVTTFGPQTNKVKIRTQSSTIEVRSLAIYTVGAG